MEAVLREYGRFLLLEGQLLVLEKEKEEARRAALAAERQRSQRKVAWQCLEEPGFFQQLLGKAEEKRDAAYRAYQEADAAWKRACSASDQAAQQYQTVKAELETLAQVPGQYAQLPKTREVRELALEAFRPAARYHLDRLLSVLEQAMDWENQERNVGGRLPTQEDGMWEQLALAKAPAGKLKEILEQFPEPEGWVCEYLKNPDGFIYDGVIMKVSPRNKIRTAIGQIQKLKDRLQ